MYKKNFLKYFNNETTSIGSIKKIKFTIEHLYRKYEGLNETYLIKNKLTILWKMNKYPKVIVIPTGSQVWIVPEEKNIAY